MRRDEQPVRVENRQHVQKHILIGEPPFFHQNIAIRQQVVLRQHRPFGAPRCARSIQDRGKVIAGAGHRGEARPRQARDFRQAAFAQSIQRFKPRGVALCDLLQRLLLIRGAHQQGRTRIGDEILNLRSGIGGIERQKHHPRRKRATIERKRLRGFVDLHGQAIPRFQAERGQGSGIGQRLGMEFRTRHLCAGSICENSRCAVCERGDEGVVKRICHEGLPVVSLCSTRAFTCFESVTLFWVTKLSLFCSTFARS